jgi:hypothetical protein
MNIANLPVSGPKALLVTRQETLTILWIDLINFINSVGYCHRVVEVAINTFNEPMPHTATPIAERSIDDPF